MTAQVADLAAQRTGDGWRVTYVGGGYTSPGGGQRVHVVDENESILRSVPLAKSLDGFEKYAHWTTAGMSYHEQLLAYVVPLDSTPYFVVRPWWGTRLVVSLDDFRPVDARPLAGRLHEHEGRLVTEGLRALVDEVEAGTEPEFDRSTDDVLRRIDTLVDLPGQLALAETIPWLFLLEERLTGGSSLMGGGFSYTQHSYRRLAQRSLRRLGERPHGHPGLTFLPRTGRNDAARAGLLEPRTEPVDGPTRHARLTEVEPGATIVDVHDRVGAPDYVERGLSNTSAFRYDVDTDDPYTLLLWFDDDDRVTRTTRFHPPFWKGPHLFPSEEHSMIGADGSTVVSFTGQLEDGSFVGTRIEVDVLHDLVRRAAQPVAGLATAVLTGDRDALPPLADALEEAGDPIAGDVRFWFSSPSRPRDSPCER